MKVKLNEAYMGFPAGTVVDTVGLVNNPQFLGKCTILSLSDSAAIPQGRKGAIVTTAAGGTFTAPDGNPFCLCNETETETIAMVIFADDTVAVSKKIYPRDNPYVLKSFVMPTPAVALFYIQ